MSLKDLRGALEPAIRRLFHVYWRFSRGVTLGVRAVVVDGQGRVFLVRRRHVAGWHLPGGGVEPGETLTTALARELAEKGNIVPETPILHGLFFDSRASRGDHVAVFVVRAFRQDEPPQANHEIAEHGFFHPDRLPDDTTPGTRRRIAAVLHGAGVAERW
jgi:ADP-ribose pyrophosphatase YjhB (NUDIX family)